MSERILIVDDESSVREFLARVLRGMNYEILEAASGEQALKKIAAADIDLVVTDLCMPGMDGLELAQRLQNQNADRPIIMMTAYAELDNARKALSIGVYDYFVKPFDIQDAIAGIRRALEHRRVVLENKAYQKDLEQKVVERTLALKQKVEDLEARDVLLQNLLSIQEPHASLGLGVKLSLSLCQASFGALYTPTGEGGFLLRAGVGFGPGVEILSAEALQDLALESLASTQAILREVLEKNRAVVAPETDPVRQGFGMYSLGVLPVRKGDVVIALLEVGRRAEDAPMSEGDLGRLEGFLPHVAMAVDDCLLQEEMPQWEGDVENFLNNTEKWTG